MRTLKEITAALTAKDNALRADAEKRIDAALDKWNGIGIVSVPIPSGIGEQTINAIADAYRNLGGFRVRIEPPHPGRPNETEPGAWVLSAGMTDRELTEAYYNK